MKMLDTGTVSWSRGRAVKHVLVLTSAALVVAVYAFSWLSGRRPKASPAPRPQVSLEEIRAALGARDGLALDACAYQIFRDPRVVDQWTVAEKADCGLEVLSAIAKGEMAEGLVDIWLNAVARARMIGPPHLSVALSDGCWDGGTRAQPVLHIAMLVWREQGAVLQPELVMRRFSEAIQLGLVDPSLRVAIAVPIVGSATVSAELRAVAREVVVRAAKSLDERQCLQLAAEMVRWNCNPFDFDNDAGLLKRCLVVALAAVALSADPGTDVATEVFRRIEESGLWDNRLVRTVVRASMASRSSESESLEHVRDAIASMARWTAPSSVQYVAMLIAERVIFKVAEDSSWRQLSIRLQRTISEATLELDVW